MLCSICSIAISSSSTSLNFQDLPAGIVIEGSLIAWWCVRQAATAQTGQYGRIVQIVCACNVWRHLERQSADSTTTGDLYCIYTSIAVYRSIDYDEKYGRDSCQIQSLQRVQIHGHERWMIKCTAPLTFFKAIVRLLKSMHQRLQTLGINLKDLPTALAANTLASCSPYYLE